MKNIHILVASIVLAVILFVAYDSYGSYEDTTDIADLAEDTGDLVDKNMNSMMLNFRIESVYSDESGKMNFVLRNLGKDSLNSDILSVYVDGNEVAFEGCDTPISVGGACGIILSSIQFPEDGSKEIKVASSGKESVYLCVPEGNSYC